MQQRLFKLIFLAAMTVYICCSAALAVWLMIGEPQIPFPELFTPLLISLVLALVLSLAMAGVISGIPTRSVRHIDVSRPDERDVEEELKPLVRRLADQNRQILSQMEALEQEHQQQDKMRREFTANVSHELKTPLTSISGFAELLRDGLVRPEDQQRFAGKIYDEAQRLIVLVGDIIRLSRLEDQPLQKQEPVSLRETARQVLQQLQHAAQKQGLQISLQGEEGWILGVPQVVEEILYNLCDNAVKYNRSDGSVTVEVSEQEDTVSVSVADTGIGIPEEEQTRIFERFYRVDKSHSRDVGGTGLGLSIVKHGVASHNARLQVESHLGSGTVITVVFPKSGRSEETDDENDARS